MRCPHCYSEVPDGAACARCGRPLHHGANDAFYAQAEKERIGLKDLFSQAFRRHARGEAFQALTRQPVPPAEALERWQKPWLFVRLFGMLLLLTVLRMSTTLRIPAECIFTPTSGRAAWFRSR